MHDVLLINDQPQRFAGLGDQPDIHFWDIPVECIPKIQVWQAQRTICFFELCFFCRSSVFVSGCFHEEGHNPRGWVLLAQAGFVSTQKAPPSPGEVGRWGGGGRPPHPPIRLQGFLSSLFGCTSHGLEWFIEASLLFCSPTAFSVMLMRVVLSAGYGLRRPSCARATSRL